jgi:hypothetical protein
VPLRRHTGRGGMEHVSTGTRDTDPELDEALASAIRLFIADAIESGAADAPAATA